MSKKNLLNPINVVVLSVLVTGFILTQMRGIQWMDFSSEIFAWMLYAVVIGGMVLRIALVMLGLFACYRLLSQSVNQRS